MYYVLCMKIIEAEKSELSGGSKSQALPSEPLDCFQDARSGCHSSHSSGACYQKVA
jgi:hypothetical protein